MFRREPFQFEGRQIGDGWTFPDLVWAYSYSAEQQYFVDQIRGRVDGAGAANVDEARAALAVSLAAQQSLDARQAVEVA
jgi:predicted dehydrogenase